MTIFFNRVAIPVLLLAAIGCSLSESVERASAGLNGGFEVVESGLPVNWLVYDPPGADFDRAFDTGDFKEGAQSLRFTVRDCSAIGGHRSPGIAQESPAVAGATYRVRFWIRSAGSDWVASAGAVDAKTGRVEAIARADGTDGWRQVERTIEVPQPYERLRFELSVRSAGTLWIDDVAFERVAPVREVGS